MFASAVLRPVAPRRQSGRLVGLDVARGFAILAMLIAHAGPLLVELPRPLEFVGFQLNDVASPLFASVMGSTAAIAVASTRGRAILPMLVQNTVRGLILIALGMLLASWGSWIAVILSFLDPHYRVTNLLPWFVFGGLLFRIGLDSRRTGATLLAVSAPAWLTPPVAQLLGGFASVASGSYLDTLHDAGPVFAVLGTIMLLASVASDPGATIVTGLFLPLRAIGSLALSLYVVQVAVVAWLASAGLPAHDGSDVAAWSLLVLGLPLASILWWRFIGKGPAEWAIGVLSGRYRTRS